MAQKFFRGHRVKVDDKMPSFMAHFDAGFEGIVSGSYSDQYGTNCHDEYSILKLNKQGKPVNRISWYHERQLTLLPGSRDEGEALLQEYKGKSYG